MPNLSNNSNSPDFLESLKWRYATKKYDVTKKVSQEEIDLIKEAVQLSASSYGLQPYQVLEISNTKLREELQPLSWNQPQITEASHLFVFCNFVKVGRTEVEQFIKTKAKLNNLTPEQAEGYSRFVTAKLQEKSETELFHWTEKQTYIALSNAMNACAALQIDSTPMEGFDAEAYNERLGLASKGLSACVLLALGYRHTEDNSQHLTKTRKPISQIFREM